MKKLLIAMSLIIGATPVLSADIDGTVESRCTVATTVDGKYGNPNAYTLTTLPASNGQVPVIRFDTTLANAYYAQITYPTSFSSSPSLSDNVTWTGAVTLKCLVIKQQVLQLVQCVLTHLVLQEVLGFKVHL